MWDEGWEDYLEGRESMDLNTKAQPQWKNLNVQVTEGWMSSLTIPGPHKQAGYMTASLHRSIRSIILAFSGASIHDNTDFLPQASSLNAGQSMSYEFVDCLNFVQIHLT